jgi:FO synthase
MLSSADDAPLSAAELRSLAVAPLPDLLTRAGALRDVGHGRLLSYSPKVFIPLTKLCRDVCHYCTFAERPRRGHSPYLSPDEVLAIAKAGAEAGCHEALFTLGDKPELRYTAAREHLAILGHATTISYLAAMCDMVVRETGLLPHANPGVLTADDIAALRRVTVSQGLMLESTSERLCQPGGVHYGSPDKLPQARLETLRLAGELKVPFTTGILIGIGETRDERLDALLAIRELHRRYGHIQEVIIQNFRAKPATRSAAAPEPDLDDLLWTIATARLILGPQMNIQAPPNLSPTVYPQLIDAGLNDWGGISPLTRDHVNPEAPWPAIAELARASGQAGRQLVPRLAAYPSYCLEPDRWFAPEIARHVVQAIDSTGFARPDDWSPGTRHPVSREPGHATSRRDDELQSLLSKAADGIELAPPEIVRLFAARGDEFHRVCAAADDLRRRTVGNTVTYAVNRNINYTNICGFKCRFCAFSKGKLSEHLRGQPYDLALDEIVRRGREAWARGATELCLQGGIHPDYTGETYIAICRALKAALPDIHIHAFSPLEIWQGAATLGLTVAQFLARLGEAGLGTLPGTAAEILDDEVRRIICPDKLNTEQWLHVIDEAHRLGLRTTATIMFGHVEQPISWARHLLAIRRQQAATRGFTEFVPLPFVHMEAPMFLRGQARRGPSFRETVLMHAVARLVLHKLVPNIQVSWVKLGVDGVKACLAAGANDLGGTLMNESISRAAGTEHGQELPPELMDEIIRGIGRIPAQRDTLYRPVSAERRSAGRDAPPLEPVVLTPAREKAAARLEAWPQT